jgi:hypothetical protein
MSNLQRRTTACYGIESFLRKKGFKVTSKTVADITCAFLKSIGLPYTKHNPRYRGLFTAGVCNAESVQEHWSEFVEFVNNQFNPSPPDGETNKEG